VSRNLVPDPVAHCVVLVEHLSVPESQYAEPCALQSSGPLRVCRRCFCVLPAIHVNHELGVETNEVEDPVLEGMLTAKLQARDLSRAQQVPKLALGIGHCLAEFALKLRGADDFAGLTTHCLIPIPSLALPLKGRV
jgi:hypothetical protein